MPITEKNRDYEILISINEDGSIGAHCFSINEIWKDGIVISATILPPVVRLCSEGQDGESLNERLGSALTTALLENEKPSARVMALEAALRDVRIA